MNQAELFISSLDRHLEQKGWSKSQLGDVAGIEPTTISKWRRTHHVPGLKVLNRLAKALGCDVKDLIDPSPSELGEPSGTDELDELFSSALEPQTASTNATGSLTNRSMVKEATSKKRVLGIQAAKEIYARLLVLADATPEERVEIEGQINYRIKEFERLCDLAKRKKV